ncbi:MAG: AraC family transcriptional regulator [Clostridia bacterium]
MKDMIIETLSCIRKHLTAENIGSYFVNFYSPTDSPQSALDLKDGTIFTPRESHKYYEMAIQLYLDSLLQIGDRYYTLNKNQFCIINHDESHRMSWDATTKQAAGMLWIGITGEIVRTGYTVYFDTSRSKVWGSDLHVPGSFIIGEIFNERESAQPGSVEAVVSYISAFLSLLLQKLNFDGESAGHSWTNKIVCELKDHIKEHLDSSLSLQDLSNLVSLSPNYLCKLFKQVTGETITNYIQDIKINKSVEYLANPSLSLSEIAEMLGFYDQFHFSKVFKSFTHMSPSEYRNTL